MTTTTTQDIGWFIDTVLLGNIHDMVCKQGQHYLGFGTVSCAIEFLGACIDSHPFNITGESRKRFEGAITTLFDTKYHQYADKNSLYDLYKYLRCGMAHIMRPQGKVTFTHHAESVVEGTQHLVVEPSIDKLVLVSETFYSDFAKACKTLKIQMAAGTYQKNLTDGYLPITEP